MSFERPDTVAFIDAHCAIIDGRPLVDVSHYLRLRLFLEPFGRTRLMCVRADDGPPRAELTERLPVQVEVQQLYSAGRTGYLRWMWLLLTSAVSSFCVVRKANTVILMYNSSPLAYAGMLLAALHRRPVVSILIGSPAESFSRRNNGRWPANRIKLIVSSYMERRLLKRSTLTFAAAGMARSRPGSRPFSTSEIRGSQVAQARAARRTDQVQWIYVGAINTEKGIDTLLDALAIARKIDRRHVLTLVGPQDSHWSLPSELGKRALDDAVEWKGSLHRSEVREQLLSADVFVFLSLHEGMPRAPLEALACGLPVVTTPTGADVYVTDRVSGLVVPTGDAAAAARAVQAITGDDETYSRMSQGAVSTAQRWTYDAGLAEVRAAVHAELAIASSMRWDEEPQVP